MLTRSEHQGLAYGDADKIAYTQHFRAALELLRLRGPEQFSSKHGTEMFDLVMESLVRIYNTQIPWKERVSLYHVCVFSNRDSYPSQTRYADSSACV